MDILYQVNRQYSIDMTIRNRAPYEVEYSDSCYKFAIISGAIIVHISSMVSCALNKYIQNLLGYQNVT